MVGLFVCYVVYLIVLVRLGGYLLVLNCCFIVCCLFGMLFWFDLLFSVLLVALIADLVCYGLVWVCGVNVFSLYD